jgi:tRNA-dihydrouridine synthase 1
MSAEGQLYNAALFATSLTHHHHHHPASASAFDTGLHPPHADLALEYLSIVKELKTKPTLNAVKGHLFKLMRPGLAQETDLREKLGKIRTDGTIDIYVELVKEMKSRMEASFSFFSRSD